MVMDATEKATNEAEARKAAASSEADEEQSQKQKTAQLYKTWEGTEGAKIRKLRDEAEKEKKAIALERANWRREQDEAERERIKDDPEKLDALTLRQRARDAEERAREAQTEAQRIKAEAIADRIAGIAEKAGVDADELTRLSHGDPETAKDIAQYMPKQTQENPDEVAPEPGTEPQKNLKNFQPESLKARGAGGKRVFTQAEIADRDFWEANKEEILEAQKSGRIR